MLMGREGGLLVVVEVVVLPPTRPTGAAAWLAGLRAVTATGAPSEGSGVFFNAVLLKDCIPASIAWGRGGAGCVARSMPAAPTEDPVALVAAG